MAAIMLCRALDHEAVIPVMITAIILAIR